MQAAHPANVRCTRKKITLPNYTIGEERLNMITHIVGAVLGLFVLLFCTVTAYRNGNTVGVVTSAIYGGSMILLYTMSSIYHGLPRNSAKKVFRVLDHCTIYLLIAGTYTPITLSAMVPVDLFDGLLVFFIEWGLAALAITLTAVDMKKFSVFSMVCYIVMGWMAFIVLPTALEAMTFKGFMFILAGGIAYTIGAVLYGIGKKKKYIHGVFHIFSVIASFLQFLGVAMYCL